MDGLAVIVLVAGVILLIALLFQWKKAQRRKYLIEKYGPEIGERIFEKKIWQGMSAEQLVESWGRPADLDTKVYKTKTSETWKYNQTGKNRFSQKVFTENGIVIGWQDQ